MDLDQQFLARARLGIQEAVSRWIYDPNVSFIDFGWRKRGGELFPDELTIRVHVKEKFAPGPVLEAAVEGGKTRGPIPDNIAGFPVDRPEGKFRLDQFPSGQWGSSNKRSRRSDPMRGGVSVSDAYRNIYATLGGLVKDRETKNSMILSNWHVLSGSWYSPPGRPILQPGRGDGGSDADTVARFTRHAMSSGIDAAVAELTGSRQLINNQLDLGPVKGVSRAEAGMRVVKSGRRTEITRGIITTVLKGVFKMTYSSVDRLLYHVIKIEPRIPGTEVSAGGDSGSIWCEESTMHAVGLHFAGLDYPEQALAIDMQPVLDALNVDLIF